MIVIKKDATNVIVCEKCSTTIQYNKGDMSLEYKPENGVFTPIIQCPVCKTNHQIKPKSFNGVLGLNNVSYDVAKSNKVLNDYTWQEISAISSRGKAEEYFKIHDQKEIVLKGGKTALVEIIGFNHDAENSITYNSKIDFKLAHPKSADELQAEELNRLGYRKQSEVAKEMLNLFEKKYEILKDLDTPTYIEMRGFVIEFFGGRKKDGEIVF